MSSYLNIASLTRSIVVGLVALLLIGCQVEIGKKKKKESDIPTTVPVAAQSVERGDISSFLRLNAVLAAESEVDVYSRTVGRVKSIDVEEGRTVRSGDVIARLEDDEPTLSVRKVTTARDANKSSLERIDQLFRQNMVSQDAYDQARLALDNSELLLQEAELLLTYTTIRAPISGIVSMRNISIGDRVDVSRPLFRIVDRSRLKFDVWLSESDLVKINMGDKGTVSSSITPEKQYKARLIMISPVVDPTYGKIKATFELLSPYGDLKPGQFVELLLTLETHTNVLQLPKKALIFEAGKPVVYITKDSLAFRRQVEIGLETATVAEITSGVLEGDLVIVDGHSTIRDSSKVKLLTRAE